MDKNDLKWILNGLNGNHTLVHIFLQFFLPLSHFFIEFIYLLKSMPDIIILTWLLFLQIDIFLFPPFIVYHLQALL